MKCNICNQVMSGTLATADQPYSYSESGLQNVLLIGVKFYECPTCYEQSAIIPKIEELNGLLAEHLILKPGLLKGEEVQFLRKQEGFQAKDFAALIGVGPSHLSRFENGKRKHLGIPTDRLIRAFCYTAHKDESGKKALQALAKQLVAPTVPTPTGKKARHVHSLAPVFKLTKNHWKSAA